MVRPLTIPHRGPIQLHADSAHGLATRRRQRCDHRLMTGYLADNDDSGCGHTHRHASTHIHMMTHTSIHIHMRPTRKAPSLPIMSNRHLGMLGLSQLDFAKLWLSQLDFAKLWLSQLDFAKLWLSPSGSHLGRFARLAREVSSASTSFRVRKIGLSALNL